MFIFHMGCGHGVSVSWINTISSIHDTIHYSIDTINSIRNLVVVVMATISNISITDEVPMDIAIDTTCAW